MDIFWLIIRTLVAYTIVFLIFRLMGKREIGELGVFDLVVFVMLADIAVISIENLDKGFWYSLIPMVVLLIIQIVTAHLSLKSQRVRELLDGKSSIIINNGKIDEREMKKQRYNLDDLLLQLHEQGIQLIQEVQYAILGPNGKLSVFKKKDNPVEVFDPLIADGAIQHQTLKKMGKDEEWLKEQLKVKGFFEIEAIFYCSLNRDGSLYVDAKE